MTPRRIGWFLSLQDVWLTTTAHIAKRLLHNHWDLSAHRRGEKCLPETSRPGLISTVRPDLPQPTHRLEDEDILSALFVVCALVGFIFSSVLFYFVCSWPFFFLWPYLFFLMDNFQLESESETGQWKEGDKSKRRYTCVPGQNQNG